MDSSSDNRSIDVLFPVLPVQIGISEAEQVLCHDQVPIAQLIMIGLGLFSMYLIVKFVLRLMKGLDKAGSIHVDRGYFAHQVQDSFYSLVAALLPVVVPVFLNLVGINVVECLL